MKITKLLTVGLLAIVLALATPKPTYACDSGILGWIVGCDPAGINSTAIEQSQIDADRQRRIAEVENAANVQIQQAQQQIELFKAQDAADERRHQAEVERMQQQFDAYLALVQAQTKERVATILGDYQTAQIALQEQSDIAISGITGATSVTRLRVIWRGVIILALVLVGGLLGLVLLPGLLRSRATPPPAQRPLAAYYWQINADREVNR